MGHVARVMMLVGRRQKFKRQLFNTKFKFLPNQNVYKTQWTLFFFYCSVLGWFFFASKPLIAKTKKLFWFENVVNVIANAKLPQKSCWKLVINK